MNIDLHSHFFPIEALSNPGKYQDRAPKIMLDNGKLKVTSQIGMRAGLGEGAYDALARIKALDDMSIDLQAISPSPILLFYWEEPAIAAHFSRKQNEAIQEIVKKTSGSVRRLWQRAFTEHSRSRRHCRRGKEYGP